MGLTIKNIEEKLKNTKVYIKYDDILVECNLKIVNHEKIDLASVSFVTHDRVVGYRTIAQADVQLKDTKEAKTLASFEYSSKNGTVLNPNIYMDKDTFSFSKMDFVVISEDNLTEKNAAQLIFSDDFTATIEKERTRTFPITGEDNK